MARALTNAASTRQTTIRILDANANRALEGLRVCEELVRFHLESPRMFRRSRALRHAIAEALTQLPLDVIERVRARASGRDIGKSAASTPVKSLEQLLAINFQRTKESLRTLEECTRILAPRSSAVFQRLRFRTYEVEREILLNVAAVRHR